MSTIVRPVKRVLTALRATRTPDVQLCEQCSSISDSATRADARRYRADALRSAYGPRI